MQLYVVSRGHNLYSKIYKFTVCVCVSVCLCVCVQSLSHVQIFMAYELQPIRFLCPWNFPGRNTGVGCHFLPQGIFSTQRWNPHLSHLGYWQEDSLPLDSLQPGKPTSLRVEAKILTKSRRPTGHQPLKNCETTTLPLSLPLTLSPFTPSIWNVSLESGLFYLFKNLKRKLLEP